MENNKQLEKGKTQLTLSTTSLQTKAIEKMLPSEKEIALATLQKKLSEWDRSELRDELLKLVGITHVNCGYTPDKENIAISIEVLVDDLQRYNSTISLEEVKLAFGNGWKKEYGDFFGLSNVTYFGWVNAYMWNEKRLRVKKTLSEAQNLLNNPKAEISEAEKEEIIKQACLREFADFKAGKIAMVQDAGNVKYNYLDRLGLITFTPAIKNQLMLKAEEIIKARTLENRTGTQSVDSVIKNILPSSVKSEAKKQALNLYFIQLIEINVELSELLPNP